MRLNKWLLSNQFSIDWRLLENIELQQRVVIFFFLFLSVIRLIMLGFPIELSIHLAQYHELYHFLVVNLI